MIYELHGGPCAGRQVAYDKPPRHIIFPKIGFGDGTDEARYILQNNAYHYQEQIPVTEPDKTDKGRHLGIIKLTRDQLRQALGLPEDTGIVDASFDTYFSLDLIAVKVEHPALPLTRPGYAIPHVEALQKTTIHSVETSEFDCWSY